MGCVECIVLLLVGERDDDELDLGICVALEEGIVDDATSFEEDEPMAEVAPALLGFCLMCDPFFCSIDSSVDAIQEERAGFSWMIFKVEGACGRDKRNVVSEVSSRWKSLDKESATSLCLPGICSGCTVASRVNNVSAK